MSRCSGRLNQPKRFYGYVFRKGIITKLKREAKVIEKIRILTIGIVTLLLTVVLGGCSDNNNVSSNENKEKILGRWTATIQNTNITAIMNFFINGSFYESINGSVTVIWGTYTITEKTIALKYGEIIHTIEYSFSNNNDTLTLIEISSGETYLVLTRR